MPNPVLHLADVASWLCCYFPVTSETTCLPQCLRIRTVKFMSAPHHTPSQHMADRAVPAGQSSPHWILCWIEWVTIGADVLEEDLASEG